MTWARLGQPGEPAADLDRGCAADAGIDLVEDEGGHRVGAASTTSMASITRDSSPPDAPAPSGRGSAPGCGCSRIDTWSRPSERVLARP